LPYIHHASGPIDAVYNSIKAVVGRPNDLVGFHVKSVTDGQSAFGEVTIKVSEPKEAGSTGRRDVAGLRRVTAAAPAPATSTRDLEDPAQAVAEVSEFLEAYEDTGKRATYSGSAIHSDIIVASAHAYVAALNRLLVADSLGNAVRGAGAIGSSV
jgi:2-isopropylmalate synthase